MRGPARGLIAAALLLLAAPPAAATENLERYLPALRELDGEELLEDEPVWLCAPGDVPAGTSGPRIVALVRPGERHVLPEARAAEVAPRGYELSSTFGVVDPTGRTPLLGASGLPVGRWEIRPASGDTAKVLARIRVVAPPGSERAVRDGLARAARLARTEPDRAASLYEAIVRRYPRTTYLTVIYWGLWNVRAYSRFANDPGRWLEEIFARFHDSCFGTIALDRYVRDVGEERAKPIIRRLVGIYPDTPLSRAAARYL